MRTRRSISILLLVALLLQMVACSESAVQETEETAAETEQALETAGEAQPDEPDYPVPDFTGLDFNGEILSIITPNWHFYTYYGAEELTGESVNDAVYYRTLNTETKLNLDVIVNQEYSDAETHKAVTNSIMAGDDAWHIVYTHSIYGIPEYATGDLLYNMDELPYVNFDAHWWDKESIEYFRIGDETYYGRGDLVLTTTETTLFNKTIADEYQLPNHYDMVREGTWTYDVFLSEVNMVSEDLNGDGNITYEDRVGFSADLTERLVGLPFALGMQLSAVTENGLEFTFWDEKYVDLYTKTLAMVTDTAHSQAYYRGDTPENQQLKFDSGRILFTFVDGIEIASLREVEFDFGVLPMPKYDEAQEKYRCYAWPTFMCVPTSIQNPEKVGAGLECFAYESMPVMEAFMLDLLRGKAVRDADSVEMLDIIYDSQVIDIAGSYLGFSTYLYLWSNSIKSKMDSPTTNYERNQKLMNKQLQIFYEKVLENQAKH